MVCVTSRVAGLVRLAARKLQPAMASGEGFGEPDELRGEQYSPASYNQDMENNTIDYVPGDWELGASNGIGSGVGAKGKRGPCGREVGGGGPASEPGSWPVNMA